MIVGITHSGEKHVLGVMAAPNKSFESWSVALQRIKRRNLDITKMRMAVSDGCAGVINTLEVELPEVPRQRCTVRKTRNVLQNAASAVMAAATKEVIAIWNELNKSEARQRAIAQPRLRRHGGPNIRTSSRSWPKSSKRH